MKFFHTKEETAIEKNIQQTGFPFTFSYNLQTAQFDDAN